jgi:excisionase family DNA binding protein
MQLASSPALDGCLHQHGHGLGSSHAGTTQSDYGGQWGRCACSSCSSCAQRGGRHHHGRGRSCCGDRTNACSTPGPAPHRSAERKGCAVAARPSGKAAPDPPQDLWAAEVADILHVSPKAVSRWAKEGKLPFLRTLGGHRRYPASRFANWPTNLGYSRRPSCGIWNQTVYRLIGLRGRDPSSIHVSEGARPAVPGPNCQHLWPL